MKKKIFVTALAPTIWASATLADSVGAPQGYDHMMWGGGYGMFGGLMMLVFWGLIIALIVFAVRWFGVNRSGTTASGALEILKARFAKGEIDEEEYRRRKAALEE